MKRKILCDKETSKESLKTEKIEQLKQKQKLEQNRLLRKKWDLWEQVGKQSKRSLHQRRGGFISNEDASSAHSADYPSLRHKYQKLRKIQANIIGNCKDIRHRKNLSNYFFSIMGQVNDATEMVQQIDAMNRYNYELEQKQKENRIADTRRRLLRQKRKVSKVSNFDIVLQQENSQETYASSKGPFLTDIGSSSGKLNPRSKTAEITELSKYDQKMENAKRLFSLNRIYGARNTKANASLRIQPGTMYLEEYIKESL